MESVNRIHALYHERPSYAIDLIRIFLGLLLLLKAIFFLSQVEYLPSLMNESGQMKFLPTLIAQYVILAHLAGGLGMVLGLLTRISVSCQIPVLLGAVFVVHLPRVLTQATPVEVQSLEYAVLVLFLMVLVALRGAGNWSLDHLIFDEKKKEAGGDHAIV
jgi:uncharacterized membrane protein YphA (DoxX/SURF4 family)